MKCSFFIQQSALHCWIWMAWMIFVGATHRPLYDFMSSTWLLACIILGWLILRLQCTGSSLKRWSILLCVLCTQSDNQCAQSDNQGKVQGGTCAKTWAWMIYIDLYLLKPDCKFLRRRDLEGNEIWKIFLSRIWAFVLLCCFALKRPLGVTPTTRRNGLR